MHLKQIIIIKKFYDKNIDEKLRDLKLYNKNLCISKFEYLDIKNNDKKKYFIYLLHHILYHY